jgi:hypothetical protein
VQPEWTRLEIERRHHEAWERFHAEERRDEAIAQEKAERERMIRVNREEERAYYHDLGLKTEEKNHRIEEEQAALKAVCDAARESKKERAAQAEAAEKRGDKTGKWPRWSQYH